MLNRQFTITILFFLVLFLGTSLACNFPGLTKSIDDDTQNIPISTQAVEDLNSNIQSAIEAVQNGQPFTVVLTESQLTSLVNYELLSNQEDRISNVQIFLRDGKVKITGDVEQSGIILPLTVILYVEVDANGSPYFTVDTATLGPLPIPKNLIEQVIDIMEDTLITQQLPAANQVLIESISISEGQMTISGTTK